MLLRLIVVIGACAAPAAAAPTPLQELAGNWRDVRLAVREDRRPLKEETRMHPVLVEHLRRTRNVGTAWVAESGRRMDLTVRRALFGYKQEPPYRTTLGYQKLHQLATAADCATIELISREVVRESRDWPGSGLTEALDGRAAKYKKECRKREAAAGVDRKHTGGRRTVGDGAEDPFQPPAAGGEMNDDDKPYPGILSLLSIFKYLDKAQKTIERAKPD